MKKILFSLLVLLVLFSVTEAKSQGKSTATFLKIGVGAKPTAMGGAFAAVADDSTTTYYNPAGLALFENKELSFTHIAWFEKINYEYLTYINPLSQLNLPGVFATNLSYLGINDIKEYDQNQTYFGEFKASDLLLNLTYARTIKPNLYSGLNLKYVNQKIKSSRSALVTDLGLLYNTSIKNLTCGLTLQNFLPLFNNFKDNLPYNIKLGACYRLLTNKILTLAMDVDLPNNDNGLRLHLGAEYRYPEMENIAIRLGYKTGVDCGNLSFGFGVNYDKYKLDYAYSSYNDLGNVHQLSLNMKFESLKSKVQNESLKPEIQSSESKIQNTNVLSPSTSLDSKPDVVFESEEKRVIEYVEPEKETIQKIETVEKPVIEEFEEDLKQEEPLPEPKSKIQDSEESDALKPEEVRAKVTIGGDEI
ncbi:MAG: PorV/PorQ family protein [bacterium]